MENHVARRRDCVARISADLAERMQLRRTRRPKQAVPRVGAKSHDARKVPFAVAETYRAQQGSQIGTHRFNGRTAFGPRTNRHDQKNRGARQRCGNRLRDDRGHDAGFLRERRQCARARSEGQVCNRLLNFPVCNKAVFLALARYWRIMTVAVHSQAHFCKGPTRSGVDAGSCAAGPQTQSGNDRLGSLCLELVHSMPCFRMLSP